MNFIGEVEGKEGGEAPLSQDPIAWREHLKNRCPKKIVKREGGGRGTDNTTTRGKALRELQNTKVVISRRKGREEGRLGGRALWEPANKEHNKDRERSFGGLVFNGPTHSPRKRSTERRSKQLGALKKGGGGAGRWRRVGRYSLPRRRSAM